MSSTDFLQGKIADLEAEIDRLRANQVPGRCGECDAWHRQKEHDGRHGQNWGICTPRDQTWPETGFCHEWKPKED